jgi:hypothetical protein
MMALLHTFSLCTCWLFCSCLAHFSLLSGLLSGSILDGMQLCNDENVAHEHAAQSYLLVLVSIWPPCGAFVIGSGVTQIHHMYTCSVGLLFLKRGGQVRDQLDLWFSSW